MPEQKTIRRELDLLVNDCNYLHTDNQNIGIEARIDYALAQIKEIRKAEVPKEKTVNCNIDYNDKERYAKILAFNQCRQEVLRRIEEGE